MHKHSTPLNLAAVAVRRCCRQVTTKKGYDGCRKADYLYAHDAITDKTFANLGETTISNLKANFDGVETGEGVG
jgi:hypothetical protein